MAIVPEPPITLLASHYGGTQDHVHRIVIHDEEFPVGINSAEEVAAYDAKPTTRYAAHYAHDSNSSQHMIPEGRIAFHAPPNEFSIGNEQDGFARFSAAEWNTPGSQGTIRRTAVAVREQADRHGVRKVWLSIADLKSPPPEARCQTCANRGIVAASGITSHANVSRAFGQSDHTDPGDHYPVDLFMSIVTETEEEEDPMSIFTEADATYIANAGGRIPGVLNLYVEVYGPAFDPDQEGQAYWIARSLQVPYWQLRGEFLGAVAASLAAAGVKLTGAPVPLGPG